MNLEQLAKRLQDNKCGLLRKTIFVAEMPPSCDEGVLLLDNYYGTQINQYLPDYFDTVFRVVVRSTDYNAGLALAKRVTQTLRTESGYVAGTMTVNQCLPQTLPRSYRRSVGGYWEFEVDMDVVFVESGN